MLIIMAIAIGEILLCSYIAIYIVIIDLVYKTICMSFYNQNNTVRCSLLFSVNVTEDTN